MNRKNYVKPHMQVFGMKAEGMLCQSNGNDVGTGAKGRGTYIFDEDDDD